MRASAPRGASIRERIAAAREAPAVPTEAFKAGPRLRLRRSRRRGDLPHERHDARRTRLPRDARRRRPTTRRRSPSGVRCSAPGGGGVSAILVAGPLGAGGAGLVARAHVHALRAHAGAPRNPTMPPTSSAAARSTSPGCARASPRCAAEGRRSSSRPASRSCTCSTPSATRWSRCPRAAASCRPAASRAGRARSRRARFAPRWRGCSRVDPRARRRRVRDDGAVEPALGSDGRRPPRRARCARRAPVGARRRGRSARRWPPLPDGEVGIARIEDLANVDSAVRRPDAGQRAPRARRLRAARAGPRRAAARVLHRARRDARGRDVSRSAEERVADVRRLLAASRAVHADRARLVPAIAEATGLSAQGVELGFASLERDATRRRAPRPRRCGGGRDAGARRPVGQRLRRAAARDGDRPAPPRRASP